MLLPKKRYIKKAIKKITVVWLLFFYLVPWSGVLALTETTHSFPTDTSFNAEGYSDDSSNVVVSSTEIKLNIKEDWWDESYLYKRNLTVRNVGTTASLSAGTPIQTTLDLTTLGLGTTKLQADLDDLRVVYSVGATHTQIARSYFLDVGNTAVATLTFPLQSELGIGATNTNYSIYYGNGSASSPPANGYDIQREGDDASATMVCPFNGTSTCVTGQTPSLESGAIRYSGTSGSALSFDGQNDYVSLGDIDNGIKTVEFWVYSGSGTNYFIDLNGTATITVSDGTISANNITGVIVYVNGIATNTISTGAWSHVAVVTDTAVNANAVNLGKVSSNYINGLIDELRMSNTARYTENFTPTTIPFTIDSNTKLLLHFDENGDDPRMTTKAIDVSGNGNHGTINGAKYVGGLVGVDSSTSSGQVLAQSTGSHSGIFIEESTTNLITNPSFEHSTYSTGWSKPYVNLGDGTTAFTPNICKRNSAGPFGQGVMVQGNWPNGDVDDPSDRVNAPRTSQLSGSFYGNFDTNQGSVAFWVTPEWNIGDLTYQVWLYDISMFGWVIVEPDGDIALTFMNGFTATFTDAAQNFTAGNTYFIAVRWDADSSLDGTYYASLTVDETTYYSRTTSFAPGTPGITGIIPGSWAQTRQACNCIIEGFTVFRRPLYTMGAGDTSISGIDVGNGDELEQIYNNGSGSDPTLITGSWDVVFNLPTNSIAGSLGVGGTGQAWSHPHSSNKLYTSTTNTGGFMMGVGYTADGWRAKNYSQSYGTGTTTFTPNVSKRNSAGPFGQGIMLTNGQIGDTSLGDANVTWYDSHYAQIAGDFYESRDSNQGTIVFWITPEWDGDDGKRHDIFGRTSDFTLYKNSSNYLALYVYGDQQLFDISDWEAGHTYNIVIRWSQMSEIGNSDYNFMVDVNNVSKYTRNTAFNNGGFIRRLNPANAVIEGLTVYRRPLFDGTNGIDVGNGDEIEQIFSSGAGQDPTLITGSWDVVFALPTNASTGSLGVGGTGQAWSHPHSSNQLYTSTTNTGGFMMGVGYTADGWSLEGTPVSVEGLGTTEKIYSGGYKWTSSDYNQGIKYTLTGLTAGQNYVVRALANSGDSVGQPKIFIYDNTNGHDITSFVGTTASTRTDPDVMLFTFELPTVARYASDPNYSWVASDTTSITVKLVNANNSGSVHFHQIEVLENTVDNPSLEVGSSNAWIPSGWLRVNSLDIGEAVKSNEGHSGFSSWQSVGADNTEGIGQNSLLPDNGKFYSVGAYQKGSSTYIAFQSYNSTAYIVPQTRSDSSSTYPGYTFRIGDTSPSWSFVKGIARNNGLLVNGNMDSLYIQTWNDSNATGLWDDLYIFNLSDVSLTVAPASLTNSTESTGVRVDGADVHTETVDSNQILVDKGNIKFTFTPRHNFDIGSSFGVANPVIMQAYGDANNYIKLHKSNSTTLQLIGVFGGTQVSVGWTNPTLNAGTSYPMVISYQSGGNLSLKVNNVNVGTTEGVVNFSTLPTTLYWGTDNGGGGSNPYDGTYLTNSGNYSVDNLDASEKIYPGGYKQTSDGVAQGVGYTLSGLTVGKDYVVRALANSDGTSIPKIQIWDLTNNHELTYMVGTTTSSRTDPDVMLFTFELPYVSRYGSDPNYSWVTSDSTSIEVRLLNSQTSGAVYWHQVEMLENLIDNPSLEIGSSDPWIPTAWSKYNDLGSGESVRETESVNSGMSAFKLTDDGLTTEGIATPNTSFQAESFYTLGFGAKKDTEGSATLEVAGSSSQILRNASSSVYGVVLGSETSSEYNNMMSVFREREARTANFWFANHHTGELDAYIDDVYSFRLSDVSLTVTAASLVNSTETSGIRIDGADVLAQTVSSLSTNNGVIKFTFTPRHNFDIGSSFGVANPVIMQAIGNSGNYLKLHKSSSTTLQLVGMFGGTQVSIGWTNPTLNAGTSYPMIISYENGGNLRLNVSGVNVGSTSLGIGFSTAPMTIYWGTDNGGGGSNPYDGTFRGVSAMSVEENTSSPYYRFGSKSVKFTAGTDNDQYTIDVGVSATNTLSAYVYDVTSGNVGGTISSSVAQLYFNNAAIGTTYMDTGGGWWRLMGQVTGVGTTLKAGVEVKANKTVYVDGVQVERKTYSTSFADGSLGVGYSWGETANASVSSRGQTRLEYVGGIGATSNVGSFSVWIKPDWDSTYNRPSGQWRRNEYLQVGNGGWGWGDGFVLHTYTDNAADSLNNFELGHFGTGSQNILVAVPMTRNNWHHIVFSWNVNTSSLYVDGGLYKDVDNTFNTNTDTGNIYLNDNGNSTVSDLKFYSGALTESEARSLYNSGLASHTGGSEEIDRYRESGVYTSSVVDLGNNGSWGSSAFQATESLGIGTSTTYSTRTSADNSTWGDWVNVGVGGSIGSTPLKYFQWKATLVSSTDQSQTPQINGMVVSYVGDASAPINPSTQATGFSAGVGTTALGSGGTNWYNYESPYFSWPAGEDAAEEGQSASGVDGYHVLFTQDVGSTPADNTSDDCYAWVDDGDGVSGGSIRLGYGEMSNCTLSDGVYYLLVQTKDSSGNVATPSQLFTYQFDSSNPSAPTIVTSTTIGYKSTNEFGFIWPAAVDQGPAGIAGYEYKTGSTDESDPFSSWQYTSDTGATNVTAYTEGQNFFYVRSVDKAGNKSATTTNLGVSPFYFNESAPTEPRNVTITPSSNASSPASSNVFSVSWDEPETYSGDIAKYYYCVNCVPSADNMTETTAAETVNRSLTDLALATQQGKNTFYIVAEDNNVNSETGVGNRNFEAYSSVDFWASTTAPGAPTGLAVTDASDRSLSKWRLTLTWIEPASGSEVDVYYIYRSIDNSSFSKIGEVSSTAYTDTDLVQSKLYYYKVYAVDNANSLSLASGTVSLAPEGKYSDPPVAGGAPQVSAGSSTATLTWTTSRSAYGTVEYGKTTSYGQAASETVTATTHSVKLTGLSSGTTYHFRIQNLDDSSMVGYNRSAAYSGDYSFTTLSAAEISDVEIKDTGLNFVVISWKTRTTSSSEVVYGKTMDYGESVVVSTSTDETEHTVRLEDLEHSNIYHFKIKGTTVDGDDIESQDITFSTVTFPKLTSYVIKTDQSTGGTTIAAAWSTNVESSSVLEYQRAEIVGDYSIDELEKMSQTELARVPIKIVGEIEEVAKNDLSFDHVIRAGSLKDGSIYVLRIKGRDIYGNELVSDPVRYVTGKDTRAPVISNVSVETQLSGSGIDANAQILVSWETDEEATSQVIYGHGTGSEYQMSTPEDKSKKTRHIVVIRDLEPNSSYHLKAVSGDSMSNTIYTQDIIAVTPSTSESALDIVLIQLEEIFGFLNF